MKIAVYAISLNEEQFARRCIESAADADCFVLADTGSTDKTKEIALECGAMVHDVSVKPWRFDHARNAALALVPADVDVCIALDLDEVLEEGWRQEIEAHWNHTITRMRYGFDWGRGIVFFSDKIHARNGYFWRHPCHELLTPDPRIQEVYVWTDKQLVTHLPDDSKSRGQYMSLLEAGIKEDPNDPRNALYYARELVFHARYDEAIVALQHYLTLPGSHYERAYAMRLLAEAHWNDSDGALRWYRRAAAEYPHIRESWTFLAKICYKLSLWAECFSAIKNALAIRERPNYYTDDPESWGSLPYDLGSIAAWHLGLWQIGIEYLQQAIALSPDDARLKENLKLYEVTLCQ